MTAAPHRKGDAGPLGGVERRRESRAEGQALDLTNVSADDLIRWVLAHPARWQLYMLGYQAGLAEGMDRGFVDGARERTRLDNHEPCPTWQLIHERGRARREEERRRREEVARRRDGPAKPWNQAEEVERCRRSWEGKA